MTNAQYVIRTAQIKGLSLIRPTKGNPGILAYDFSKKDARGVFPCVIDAANWSQAREQINNYYRPAPDAPGARKSPDPYLPLTRPLIGAPRAF